MRHWKRLLVIAFIIVSVAAWGQQVKGSGAEDILTRANSLGASKDYDGAISLLQTSIERYPGETQLYLALGDWLEARGMHTLNTETGTSHASRNDLMRHPEFAQDIFDTYGLATMYLADTRQIQWRVNELISDTFPVQLGKYGVLALPGNAAPFTYELSDTRLPAEERGLQQGLITTAVLPTPAAYRGAPNPRQPNTLPTRPSVGYNGWVFSNIIYAYAYDQHDQTWRLRFRIMWQNSAGKSALRQQFAQQTAQFLLQLYGTVKAYMGVSPRWTDDGALNVWLTEAGDPGAEATAENIYLYNLATPRNPEEWIRELTHEYGHLALKPVGGYSQPEENANGRLGERLFMYWLAQNKDSTEKSHPWVAALNSADFTAKRVLPLIQLFAAGGPNSTEIRSNTATAMDTFVGMALYLAISRSGQYLASIFADMATPLYAAPNGFLASLEHSTEPFLQSTAHPSIMLRLHDLPLNAPNYVYLTAGSWKGELFGTNLPTGKLNVAVDGKFVPVDLTEKCTIGTLKQGWHTITISPAEGIEPPDLTAIKLTRE